MLGTIKFDSKDKEINYSFEASAGNHEGLCFIKDLNTFELFFIPDFHGFDEYKFEFPDMIDFGPEAILISPDKGPP